VIEEMSRWHARPLDRVYPVVFVDAIVVKIRDGQVANRPVYVAIGVTVDGERDILSRAAPRIRAGRVAGPSCGHPHLCKPLMKIVLPGGSAGDPTVPGQESVECLPRGQSFPSPL
jgi:Transposase, Mutator family